MCVRVTFIRHPTEPEPPVMSNDQRKALMYALKVCDTELVVERDSVQTRTAIHVVRKYIADAVIKGCLYEHQNLGNNS